jgi:hypothetical protein
MMLQPFFHLKVKQIPRLTFDRRTLWAILISTVLLMSALSRESIFLAVLLVSAAILLFLELWGVPQHHHKDDQLTIKSKWVWALVALTVALIELSALLAARFTGDDQKYATISELVVPVLDTQWNRFIFGIVWIMVGWLVIRHWRRK